MAARRVPQQLWAAARRAAANAGSATFAADVNTDSVKTISLASLCFFFHRVIIKAR